MNFVAIDVETANASMDSICQIGIARFADSILVDEWSTLVDPEDYFSAINVSIHGIESDMVAGQPTLPEIFEQLRNKLEDEVVVCHTHFDRVALTRAFAKYDLNPLNARWLDSARVARRTWEEIAWSGYGLANVCNKIGYVFRHHDALEDAKAAGQVLLAACQKSQQGIDYWMRRVNQPIGPTAGSYSADIRRVGNPDGDLFGEVVVFTGRLELPRWHAADLAAALGCEVSERVTKKTTILVVGDQDIQKLAGNEKSAKHRKAEQLFSAGHSIRFVCETDFQALVKTPECSG